MSHTLTYCVLLDLCERKPETSLDRKVSKYAFNILGHLLMAGDCGKFLVSQCADRVITLFTNQFKKPTDDGMKDWTRVNQFLEVFGYLLADDEEIARVMMDLKFHHMIADLFEMWAAAKPNLGIEAFCQCFVQFCQTSEMQKEIDLERFLTLVFKSDLHVRVTDDDRDESTESESENTETD